MIELKQVSKRFVNREVVSDLSFVAERGEVLGFLGPNGAGKSTTMKMITGFLPPSAGAIYIDGQDIMQDPIRAKMRIGYLPEGAPLYQDMEVGHFLSFIADVRQLRGQYRLQCIAKTLEQMELKEVVYQPIGTLSKGFVRRVGIAQALIHDPEILILDEPTDGLDPNQKHHVRQLIKRLASHKLIVVSTHILEEVSAVCTRAIIIHQGRKIVDDTPGALEAQSRYFRAVSMHLESHADMDAVLSILRNQPGLSEIDQDYKHHIRVLSPGGEVILPRISELIRYHGWPLKDLYVERGRLEEVFRSLTVDSTASMDSTGYPLDNTTEVA